MSSRDSQEFVLGWVGAVTGVLGVILGVLAIVHPEGFPISPALLAYMSATALVSGTIATGFWRWIRKMIKRPDVETVSIVVALTIDDKSGKSATLNRTQVDFANRKVLSHTLTVGGIGATGTISEIRIDGHVIPRSEWESQVTEWQVTRTQQTVLDAGKSIPRELQMKLVDSFVSDKETLSHEVADNVRELTLKVKFPKDRNPAKLSTFFALGNRNRETLKSPTLEPDGFYAIIVKGPQLGGTYRIEWEW